MEDIAVFIALSHSGSFRMCFVKFKKKMLFTGYGSVRMVKNCTASGSIFKTSVTAFHHTDLPAGK